MSTDPTYYLVAESFSSFLRSCLVRVLLLAGKRFMDNEELRCSFIVHNGSSAVSSFDAAALYKHFGVCDQLAWPPAAEAMRKTLHKWMPQSMISIAGTPILPGRSVPNSPALTQSPDHPASPRRLAPSAPSAPCAAPLADITDNSSTDVAEDSSETSSSEATSSEATSSRAASFKWRDRSQPTTATTQPAAAQPAAAQPAAAQPAALPPFILGALAAGAGGGAVKGSPSQHSSRAAPALPHPSPLLGSLSSRCSKPLASPTQAAGPAGPLRILVVAACPVSASTLVHYCELFALWADYEADAEGAKRRLCARTAPYDLVVVEPELPGMSGYDLCGWWKARASAATKAGTAASTPCTEFVCIDEAPSLEQCKAHGVAYCFAKPFSIRCFATVLCKWLTR